LLESGKKEKTNKTEPVRISESIPLDKSSIIPYRWPEIASFAPQIRVSHVRSRASGYSHNAMKLIEAVNRTQTQIYIR